MSDVLNVAVREETGTAKTRRLRQQGLVPAVLYGHGEANVHLSVPKKEIDLLLRHQSKHVALAGAVTDHAIVKDLQWDPLGIEVLHLDLVRVSMDEKVTVTLPVKLHGEPVGLQHHGSLNEILHEVEISVTATDMPDELVLNVNDLDIGQSKTAADIEMPTGGELVTDPTAVVVTMNVAAGEKEVETAESGLGMEPEVIGAKEDE